jgi:hypothetical protein
MLALSIARVGEPAICGRESGARASHARVRNQDIDSLAEGRDARL